jgi:hypothetical protein
MEEMKMHTKFLAGNLKGRNHFRDLAINGRKILKHFIRKYCVRV